jgi:hypothetical protein
LLYIYDLDLVPEGLQDAFNAALAHQAATISWACWALAWHGEGGIGAA